MFLSLKEAAKVTGKSKPAILRAIESHELSAARDEVGGEWRVEPSELYRVFPPVPQKPLRNGETMHGGPMDKAALRREIEVRDQQLAALREERERERADKDRQIDSLTEQLMAANEERRTMLRQLTALLTDQRAPADSYPSAGAAEVIAMPPPAPAPAAPAKEKGWFRRMIGGR
jgi:excisionase family DNA binding protein